MRLVDHYTYLWMSKRPLNGSNCQRSGDIHITNKAIHLDYSACSEDANNTASHNSAQIGKGNVLPYGKHTKSAILCHTTAHISRLEIANLRMPSRIYTAKPEPILEHTVRDSGTGGVFRKHRIDTNPLSRAPVQI